MFIKKRIRDVGALAVTSAIALSALAVPAFAQIEEIIVTAQKREESMQSVPIAVTAFDSDALKDKQIDDFSDLQFNTPSVYFTRGNFDSSNIVIRGIGVSAVADSADAGVGIHVNEIPIMHPRIFEMEYFDVNRVEILRGPQGTLFGRNSTGGLVNVITNTPTDEFTVDGEFQYGNYNHMKLKGAINIPLGDKFGVRLAGITVDRDGYSENLYTGNDIDGRNQYGFRGTLQWRPGDNTTINLMMAVYDEDSSRPRGQKVMCHNDPTGILGCLPDKLAFENTNSVSNFQNLLTTPEFLEFGLGFPGFVAGAVAITPSVFAPPVDQYAASPNPADYRKVYMDFDPIYEADETLYTLTFDHDFDRHTLSLVAGYQETTAHSQSDYNQVVGQPLPDVRGTLEFGFGLTGLANVFCETACDPFYVTSYFPTSAPTTTGTGVTGGNIAGYSTRDELYDNNDEDHQQWSVEARLASNFDGAFNYLIGGFFLDYDINQSNYEVFSNKLDYLSLVVGTLFAGDPDPLAVYGWVSPYFSVRTDDYNLDSWALFGEVYYDLAEDLQLTVGARYNSDEKHLVNTALLVNTDEFGIPIIFPLGLDVAVPVPSEEQTASWEEVTGRVVLDWMPELDMTDSTLVYASYSRGFKGGGFNPATDLGLGGAATFDPEFINAYEIGTKNSFADNRVQLNLTGFYYDYTGYQISKIVNRSAVNENFDAKIWGLEGEFVAAPNENWLLNAMVSYNKSEVGDVMSIDPRDPTNGEAGLLLIKDPFTALNCVLDPGTSDIATVLGEGLLGTSIFAAPVPMGGGLQSPGTFGTCDGAALELTTMPNATLAGAMIVEGIEADVGGNQMPNTPELSINLGAQYTHYYASQAQLAMRVDYYWQKEVYSRLFNKPIDEIDAWSIWNAQATYTSAEGDWYAKAFIQNILDEDYVTGMFTQDASTGLFSNVYTLEPRLYGVTFGFNF